MLSNKKTPVLLALIMIIAGVALLLSQSISVTLARDTSQRGVFQESCQTHNSTDTPAFIPDLEYSDIPRASTISVVQSGYVTSVAVTLNIEQHEVNDLRMYLAYPGLGAQTTRFYYSELYGANFTNTTFTNDGDDGLWEADPPFTGTWRPVSNVWFMGGMAATGDWVLSIYDDYYMGPGTQGTLLSWSITLCTSESTPTASPGYTPTYTRTPTPTVFATRTEAWSFMTDNEDPVPGDWDVAEGTVVPNTTPANVVSGSQSYQIVGLGSYIAKNWATDEPNGGEMTFDVVGFGFPVGFTIAEAANSSDGDGYHWRMYVGASRNIRLDFPGCNLYNQYIESQIASGVKRTYRILWNSNLNNQNAIIIYYFSSGYWYKLYEAKCPSLGTEANNDWVILGSRINVGTPAYTPAFFYDRAYIGTAQEIPTSTPTATLAGAATATPVATPSSFDFYTSNEAAVPGDFDGTSGTINATTYWATDGTQSYLVEPGASYIHKTWGTDVSGGDLIFTQMIYPPTSGTLSHQVVRVANASDGSNPNWAIRRWGGNLYLDYYDCGQMNKYIGNLSKGTTADGPWLLTRVVWTTNVDNSNSIRVYTYCDAATWLAGATCRTYRNYQNWKAAAAFQCPSTGSETSGDVVIFGSSDSGALGQWMFDDVGITEASPLPTMDVTATPTATPTRTTTPTPTSTPTAVVTVEQTPVFDTYISVWTPDEPMGEDVVVKEAHGYWPEDHVRGLFAFDMSDYALDQITSAHIKFYVRGLRPASLLYTDISLFRITNPFWTEAATWNSTGFGNWYGRPGMGPNQDFTWSHAIPEQRIDGAGWVTLDVLPMIREAFGDTPGYFGILVTGYGYDDPYE